MWKHLMILLCASSAIMLEGCAIVGPDAAQEAIGTFKGPKAIYREITPFVGGPNAKPLSQYSRFEVRPFTDAFGGMTPEDLMYYIPIEVDNRLISKNRYGAPEVRTLVVTGQILYHEDQSLGRTILNPLEEVIARVQLTDKETKAVIGVAICVSRTTSRTQANTVRESLRVINVRSGAQSKASALAKAISEWIDSRYR
jgi:hypothetical protein